MVKLAHVSSLTLPIRQGLVNPLSGYWFPLELTNVGQVDSVSLYGCLFVHTVCGLCIIHYKFMKECLTITVDKCCHDYKFMAKCVYPLY